MTLRVLHPLSSLSQGSNTLFPRKKYCLSQCNGSTQFSSSGTLKYTQIFKNQREYSADIPRVFDRRVKTMQRNRAAEAPNSRDFDFLKKEVAERLVERLEDMVERNYRTVVDLGAHTGYVSKALQDSPIEMETLYQIDLSESMLRRDMASDAENYPRVIPRRVVGDEEWLPLASQSVDLVLSSLSLHWVNDLEGVMREIQRILRPNGVFLAVLWGARTLQEWRSCFVLAEEERHGGVAPHLSPFADLSDLGALLTQTRWALPTVDTEMVTVQGADPLVFLRDVQGMGESAAPWGTRPPLRRSVLLAAAAVYRVLYGVPEGPVPCSFQLNYLIAWAPHPSQPRPLPRGSAKTSLKTLGEGKSLG